MLAGVEAARGQAGEVRQWGSNKTGDPNGNDFIQVETGWLHTVALRTNGTVICSANDPAGWGCLDAPGPNEHFVYIAAGYYHNLGIRTDGTLRIWGKNVHGEAVLPPEFINDPNVQVIAVAAGEYISCAIKADGSLVVWGPSPPINCGDDSPCVACPHAPNDPASPQPPFPIAPAPPGPYVGVSCSGHFWLAQRADGTLVGKGIDTRCQVTDIPTVPVARFSAGHMHGAALTASTQPPLLWGRNQFGQAQLTANCPANCPSPCQGQMSDPCVGSGATCWRPPPIVLPAIKDVESAYYSTIDKKIDNTLTGWGFNDYGTPCPVPGEVAQFSCNYHHGGAILIAPDSDGAYANCDGDGGLDFNDLACFNAKYAQGDPLANCDSQLTVPLLSASDVICFIQKFTAGLP
ncbi:MAG: hypothetical protein JNM80_01765 [Phycisphaerae bacterium]|nr:hypothetical protein [Phycisphaerae bacterium]